MRIRIEDCTPCVVDVECFYSPVYSLSKMTTESYCRDPQFEFILISVKYGKNPVRIITGTKEEIKRQLLEYPWHQILGIAHNAAFDFFALFFHFGIVPAHIACTQRLAAPFYGHTHSLSLASLSEVLRLPPKGTAVHNMIGKHRLDLTPQEFKEYADYCAHDGWLCWKLFLKFAALVPIHELYALSASLLMYVRPTLTLDRTLLQAALQDEATKRTNILTTVRDMLAPAVSTETIKGMLASNQKFPAVLDALGIDVPQKQNAKGEWKPTLAKTDPGFEELLNAEDETVRTLCEARLIVKSTQAESRARRFFEIAQRGAMPFPVHWCGALAAHRWSAWDQINLQNLGRGSFLRKAVVAPPGYQMIVGDLSQIELRAGWWLAGQFDNLERFVGGHDPYRQIMTDTFGMPYESMPKDSLERQCGKVICLSGIYGTAAKKARHTVRVQAGKTISLNEAEQLIRTYRRGNQQVVAAWGQGNLALNSMYVVEPVSVWKDSIIVVKEGLRKPDGLLMLYPNLRPHQGQWDDGRPKTEWTYERRKGRALVMDHMYGAKLFQNVTQSLARDIMALIIADLMRTLPEGCFIVGTVHDEVIILAPNELAETVCELVRMTMVKRPWWAPDLPLATAVSMGTCYGAIK